VVVGQVCGCASRWKCGWAQAIRGALMNVIRDTRDRRKCIYTGNLRTSVEEKSSRVLCRTVVSAEGEALV
jgi:hypothetical protein